MKKTSRLIPPEQQKEKRKNTKSKHGRSIRNRIVVGYVSLYFLIALIALVAGALAWYVSSYYQMRADIEEEVSTLLTDLPLTTNYEELYQELNSKLPRWVSRYDLYLVYETYVNEEQNITKSNNLFLFCKDGLGLTTEQHFDYTLYQSPIYNLTDINHMYLINQSSHDVQDYPPYGMNPYYRIKAVVNLPLYHGGWLHYQDLAIFLGLAYFFVFSIGLVLVIVFGASQTRKYLLPIQDITNLASQLGSNNLNMRLDVDSAKYELKELVIAINAMLDRVYATYAKQRHFVSDVSHELRTPISVINGYANMLKRWARDDKVVFDESVDAIIEEADNMKNLVENLLFLARCDNKTLAYDMEKFNLSELIENIFRDTEITDGGKHTVTSDIDPDVILCGDRSRIKQAVRAFVSNAVKYTPPFGEVHIGLKTDEKYANIVIKDTGLGISKKDLGHIFRRFYRGDRSRTRKDGGYGLGLAIARAVVVSHHGKIKMSSQEDIGTTATILLPFKSFDL